MGTSPKGKDEAGYADADKSERQGKAGYADESDEGDADSGGAAAAGEAGRRGGRFSYGVDRTTVVRVVTFAAVRISCSRRSKSAGLATLARSM
jgi:hypothetical protein